MVGPSSQRSEDKTERLEAYRQEVPACLERVPEVQKVEALFPKYLLFGGRILGSGRAVKVCGLLGCRAGWLYSRVFPGLSRDAFCCT